jgi:hypothetical protein
MLTKVIFTFLVAGNYISSAFGDEIWKLYKMNLSKFPNALCLDGSPAAFWFLQGSGSGANKFKIHHQGGGWCADENDCYSRSLDPLLGSSNTWESNPNCDKGSTAQPCSWDGDQGLTDFVESINPVAYNWNKVYLGYCDGASFSGHVPDPVSVNGGKNKIHFKGRYILDAMYDTLINDLGMNNASAVIISGTSAGGLAVYLHADYLNNKITTASIAPTKPRITAVPDAGFFMDYPSIHGNYLYTPVFQNVFKMQKVSDSVDEDCMKHYSSTDQWKCFMAPYTLPFISTELFITNPLADSWQATYIMGLTCDPTVKGSCTQNDIDYLNGWRENQLENSSLKDFLANPNSGAWLCECYFHPILNIDYSWQKVFINRLSQEQTFTNWYFRYDKSTNPWIAVDGEWGSNTC